MWIVLSLLSAFFLATSDAILKSSLRKENELLFTFLRFVFALPVLLLSLPFIRIPSLDLEFWIVILTGVPLEITAIVLYVKAIRSSDLSLTLPMLSLTPVFLIIVSWVFLNEKVSLIGMIGIFLVAIGTYTMNISMSKKGILYPFVALYRDKGVQYMVIVAIIYSFTSTLGKIGILHSSVLFFPVLYFTAVTITFSFLVFNKTNLKKFPKNLIIPATSGIFFGLMIISHMIAISIAKVAYMIAIKRTSIVFGAIYGFVLFKEKGIQERLTGSIMILAGVFLIAYAKT